LFPFLHVDGHLYPSLGAEMKPLGDAFIKLIKMIIAPIIFCTVVVGIAGMEDMKQVGKWTGDLDVERKHRHLNNETIEEAEAPEEVLDQTEAYMPISSKAT
jgi:hypothetical protein